MKLKVLLIGGDSFIARKFISAYSEIFNFKIISRKITNQTNETIIEDLFTIGKEFFIDTDAVLNFAAIVHQPKEINENLYYKVNADLPIYLAKSAKEANVKIFVQMSTISVYGQASLINKNTAENPINIYGKSKLKADKILTSLQSDNFKIIIIRPSMVYGAGNAPGNMMRLIKLVDKGLPLPFRNIDNKRDFIHVNNLLQIIYRLTIEQSSGIFLVCDNQPVSTFDLITLISLYLGKNNRAFYIPKIILSFLKMASPGNFEKLFGNLIIESNINFILSDSYSIKQGVKEMVDWYLSNK